MDQTTIARQERSMAQHPTPTGQPVLDDAEADVPTQPGEGVRSAAAAAVGARYGVPTAGDVMNRRPPIADQDTSLWGAWGRLRGAGCRHLVVVDYRSRPVGVLEERDLALRWPPGPFEAHRVLLRHVVRGQARPRARSGDDVATVARAMLAARTDAVPVVDDDGRLVGLVTARHCTELVACRRIT
jgi:CBS domain-containing protein